jgi:hypothetical protein
MSLGLLVGRFGTFIRETHGSLELERDSEAEGASSEGEFPDQLNHARDAVAHHLIPLLLLARADNDFAPQERDVIVAHCITLAGRQGINLVDSQVTVLTDYISDYRPSLIQLDPALHRLARSSHDDVADLFTVAKAVVEADGITRPEEARFLANLSDELVILKTGS